MYNIYRDGTIIDTSPLNSYSDTSLRPSTTYTYNVKAWDAAGNKSDVSAPVSATTLDEQTTDNIPPLAPSNLSILFN